MIPEKVIITLQDKEGIALGDYELPSNVSTGKFIDDLAGLLKETVPGHKWSGEKPWLYYKGSFIREDESLASRGVWDGAYVTVS